jgi:hypothetical protein
MRRVECSWWYVHMIVIFIATEKNGMFLQEHFTLLRNCQHNYHIHKLSRTFNSSLILSIYLEYTQKRRGERSWRFLYMIVILIISEKSWMSLTICVHDSFIDNFWEELNYNYHIQKSSESFTCSQKLSTDLKYTQIVKNIQLFS